MIASRQATGPVETFSGLAETLAAQGIGSLHGGAHGKRSLKAELLLTALEWEQLEFVQTVVMIYGTAALDGVPWEIVIKNFRDKLGSTKHGSLHGYAAAFFEFVQRAEFFFPQLDLDFKLLERTLRIALDLIKWAREADPEIDDADKSLQDRQTAWQNYARRISAGLAQRPVRHLTSNTSSRARVCYLNRL